ncbi:extracellular solute-binding protein [Marinicrinis lubricantis]|uniref:Extracellular solute-binding protein n=1 Tax=Marinicrinis lubricantis TaxID=2086470 RepID=A0ABW1IJN1_9BACL
MKKWLALVLTAVMLFTVAACGSGGNSGNNGNNEEGEGAEQSSFTNGKYDPPITLTTVKGLDQNASVFKEGETVEDNVHTRLIKERLGIDIKYDWVVTSTNDGYKNKLRLMLSSGEKMPDVVMYRGDSETVNLLIDSGQFMAVDELFEQYAGEEYKKGVDLDPTIWYPITRDGKKMALPILDYAYNGDNVLWIREDWLKKLNLKAPTTIEEMEQVMEAFVTQDPDGNGEDDTIGLATGFKNGFNNWMTDIGFLFGAYGTMPGQWNMGEDGKLEHGSIQPEAKEALLKLNEWLEKGYIHQDAALKDETTGSEYFTKGQAGMMVGPNWLPDWPFPDLESNVPDAEYKAYPIPSGPNGKIGTAGGNPPVNGYIFINKDAEHPEAILHYYNWFFDNMANPQPGSEFENGFAEGYDYAILEDGTLTSDPAAHPELFPGNVDSQVVNPMYYTLTYEGARIPTLYAEAMVKLAEGGTAETPYEKSLASYRKKENIDAMKVVMDQVDIRMKNYYMGPLTKTMESKNELLNKMLNETYNKIIYGQASADEFDKMVDNWLKSGGEEITKEVNEWYDSVK